MPCITTSCTLLEHEIAISRAAEGLLYIKEKLLVLVSNRIHTELLMRPFSEHVVGIEQNQGFSAKPGNSAEYLTHIRITCGFYTTID